MELLVPSLHKIFLLVGFNGHFLEEPVKKGSHSLEETDHIMLFFLTVCEKELKLNNLSGT